jgi:hypothetical protein
MVIKKFVHVTLLALIHQFIITYISVGCVVGPSVTTFLIDVSFQT